MIKGEMPARKELDAALDDWGLHGGEESWEAWNNWTASDRHTLPFAGGWFDQPWWVRADFRTLNTVRLWHEANEKLTDSKTLPKWTEVDG
jgi:hypothetical protein